MNNVNHAPWMYPTRNLALVLTIALGCLFSANTATAADKVVEWNAIGSIAAANANRGPATFIDLTYMHIAVYDSVNMIDGRYRQFAVAPQSARTNASKEAAAVSAAFNVLRLLYPNQQSFLEQKYEESLSSIPDGIGKDRGIAVGEETAVLYMSSRSGDGRNASVTYTPASGPGKWVPTPPANLPAAFPWIARMRPFSVLSPSQFRADGPSALTSSQWAEEYNEVKRLGSVDSSERTAEQTEAGLFYVEGAGGQSARAFRRLADEQGLNIADSARLFAMIYVSISDALITCWESKYHYSFWRPVTAIRAGHTDENSGTEPDANWTPLAPTPNFPEYVSAHSAVAGGFSEAMRHFFGTKKVLFRLDSVVTGTIRTFNNTDDIPKDVADARVYAGFHFRTACVHGALIGKKVAHWVAANHFQAIEQ